MPIVLCPTLVVVAKVNLAKNSAFLLVVVWEQINNATIICVNLVQNEKTAYYFLKYKYKYALFK
jgi:hypothetical protein